MGRRIAGTLGAAILFLVAFMVYMNVLSSDGEVRKAAEAVAKQKLGCADCTPTRIDGTSRVIDKKYTFTFSRDEPVRVVCRRRYIALGEFACTAQ